MKIFCIIFAATLATSLSSPGMVHEIFTAFKGNIFQVMALGDVEPAQVIYPREDREYSLAVHDDRVYWSTVDAIHRGDLEGATRETFLAGRESTPLNLMIDPASGFLYWCEEEEGGPWRIYRAGLDSGEVEALVERSSMGAIALDPDGERLYWIEPDASAIMRADLDGGNLEDITPAYFSIQPSAHQFSSLTVAPGVLYFWISDGYPGCQFYSFDLEQRQLRLMFEEYYYLTRVHYHRHDGMLYQFFLPGDWSVQTSQFPHIPHHLERHFPGKKMLDMSLYGHNEDLMSTEDHYEGTVSIHQHGDQTQVWFVDNEGIKKKNLPSLKVLDSGAIHIGDLKLVQVDDASAGRLFWTAHTSYGGVICGMDTSGSNRQEIVFPHGWWETIAVDAELGFIYWADPGQQGIYRATLSFDDITQVISGNPVLGFASCLVIDSAKGDFYWVDGISSIKSYNMATGILRTVTASALQPLWPVLDSERGVLYYYDTSGINCIAVDGSDQRLLYAWPYEFVRAGDGPMQLDAQAGKLYMSLLNQLWCFNTDGTSAKSLGLLANGTAPLVAVNILDYRLTLVGSPRVAVGSPVTLRVGSLPTLVGAVTYEWYKDGALIAGANAAEYTIASAAHTDAGEYQLLITDESKGTYLSAPFVLTVVNALPVGGLTAMGLLLGAMVLMGVSHVLRRRA